MTSHAKLAEGFAAVQPSIMTARRQGTRRTFPLLEPRTPAAEALVLNRTVACPDPRSSPAPGAKNALVTTGAVIGAASRSEQRLRGGRPPLEQGGTSGVKIPCRRIDPPIEAPPTPARPHRPVDCAAASREVTGSRPQSGGCRP